MRTRCYNKKNNRFANYGGRGISVCERWRKFENFLEDMGEKPAGMTIERKDVNRGYCKDNCEWISAAAQQFNTTRTRFVEIDGERMHLKAACAKLGLPYRLIISRINSLGWTQERALTEGKRVNKYC